MPHSALSMSKPEALAMCGTVTHAAEAAGIHRLRESMVACTQRAPHQLLDERQSNIITQTQGGFHDA
jgi:hypothetical protein